MPIAREGGFLRWADAPHLPGLGIESVNRAECIAQIKALGLKGVFGSPGFGFEEENLDFLNEIPFIESVWFWDVALKNIDGLYALENLRHFSAHPKRPPIQFDRFPHLETAVVTPRPKDSGLERLGELHTLHLWHFKEKDYATLALPNSLVELKLFWASPSSLEQLQALPNLRRLHIEHCRNLESLGDLGEKFPNLDDLLISTCGRVTPDEGARATQGLTKLKKAIVQSSILA